MVRKPFYLSTTFWGLALTAAGVFVPKYANALQGAVQDVVTAVGLVTSLYGRWKATKPLTVLPVPQSLRILPLLLLPLLASAVSAQTYLGGGVEVGGNSVNFRNDSRIGGVRFRQGQNIDRYAFFGGFAEAQYGHKVNDRLSLNGRGLLELSTDPKNLGMYRDGARFHIRPELEGAIPVYDEWKVLVNGGVGFTHIWNDQYGKSGLNPHAGAGVSYDDKYRFTFARIFKDTTNLNNNETEGWRFRGDVNLPLSHRFGILAGVEVTPYNNKIPGVRDCLSRSRCRCLETEGTAFVFRVGVARLFKN